jgi:hypothetical protein
MVGCCSPVPLGHCKESVRRVAFSVERLIQAVNRGEIALNSLLPCIIHWLYLHLQWVLVDPFPPRREVLRI